MHDTSTPLLSPLPCSFINFGRFLNLEKNGDNAESAEEEDENNDALGNSLRRLLTFVRRTSISALGHRPPERVEHTPDTLERLNGVDEGTLLLTTNGVRGNGGSCREINGGGGGGAAA